MSPRACLEKVVEGDGKVSRVVKCQWERSGEKCHKRPCQAATSSVY